MNIRNLIPRSKYDLEPLQHIQQISADEIEDILPELFEWLQDFNWPVAKKLSTILPRFGDRLLPHIHAVLQSGDPQWQYSMLEWLIRELPKDTSLQLTETIRRIAETPTKSEILEELHILAKDTLDFIRN